MTSDQEKDSVESIRQEMAEVANGMLKQSFSFLEGARYLSRIRWHADLENDPDVMVFVAIDDETDALPIGEVRQHWLPEALEKKQPEIEKAEKSAREDGTQACKNIIERFGKGLK